MHMALQTTETSAHYCTLSHPDTPRIQDMQFLLYTNYLLLFAILINVSTELCSPLLTRGEHIPIIIPLRKHFSLAELNISPQGTKITTD
jgi:hypothetical protein